MHKIYSKLIGLKFFYFNCEGSDIECRHVANIYYVDFCEGNISGNGFGNGSIDCQGQDGGGASYGNGGATPTGDGFVNDSEFNFFQ